MATTTSGSEIKERREKLGWSQHQLAKAVNSHPHTISKIETGAIKFSRFLLPIRKALGIVEGTQAPDGFLEDTAPPALVPASATRYATLRCYYASAAESEDSAMVLRPEPTTLVPRPAALRDFDDAYAVVVPVSAMAPAYNVGDTLYVNPYLPPEPGKDVLLRKDLNGSGTMMIPALLVDITRDEWLVRQHGSVRKKDFAVSKAQYPRCHRIIGKINR